MITELLNKEIEVLTRRLNKPTQEPDLRRNFASRLGSLQTTTNELRAYMTSPAEYNPTKCLAGVNVLLNDVLKLVDFLHAAAKAQEGK